MLEAAVTRDDLNFTVSTEESQVTLFRFEQCTNLHAHIYATYYGLIYRTLNSQKKYIDISTKVKKR
jgi:hypothetical protein